MLSYNIVIEAGEEISIQEIDEVLTSLAKLCGDGYFTWDSPTPFSTKKIGICLHMIKSTKEHVIEKLPELYGEFPDIKISI